MPPIPRPDPPLTDGVVRLRPLELDDAPAVVDAARDADVARWTRMAEGLDLAGAREWIERAHASFAAGHKARFAIVAEPSGEFCGQIGIAPDWPDLTGEIYYWTVPAARRRGLTARAVRLVTTWAFAALGLARVYVYIDPRNEASQRTAVSAGFLREGVLRSAHAFKGGRMDSVVFSRLPTDP